MRVAALILICASLARSAYLGLRNQGNTCYMNSLLQALHHLPEFRDAVFSIPTSDSPTNGTELVPLELQRVFYELQNAEDAGAEEVGTERLTRSFGWGVREVMVQQDVQEFSRMLCDMLQASMQAHGVVDSVAELFEGRTASLTRCTRVDFKSEKEERFYDLQLQVAGCPSLHHSLRHFVKEESFTGDNQYNTRDPALGKQDAKRSVRFKRLPPVLQLHLKRFEYNHRTGDMQKLQEAFAFPTNLKLNRYMAPDSESSGGLSYTLHAVLSHMGDAGSGHYIAYVRPRGSSQWYEFDDTRVKPVAQQVAVRQQYGGRYGRGRSPFGMGAHPNAYMLIYVRDDLQNAGAAGETEAALLPPKVRDHFEATMRKARGRGGAPGLGF